jgi:hypothetical protein
MLKGGWSGKGPPKSFRGIIELCSSGGKVAFVGIMVWADAIRASPNTIKKRRGMMLATVDVVMLIWLAKRR